MNKATNDTSKSVKEEGLDPAQVRALVARAQKGDQAAFGELVMAYNQRVYNVVYQVVRHTEDAKELTQQTWVKAWKKLHTFKGKSGFFTWVYRIAHFGAVDLIRKRQRRKEDEWLEGVEPSREASVRPALSRNPRPDRELERSEVRAAFDKALEGLTPEHREALVLREVEGFSYDEIAKVMKCRKGTVMSRLYYARKKIQEELKEVL